MEVFIKGAWITLTKDQEQQIAQANADLREDRKGFEKVLLDSGFKKVKWEMGNGKKPIIGYEHTLYEWCAEIIEHNNRWHEVFMIGTGLRHASCPPGGWLYGGIEELRSEIWKAIEAKMCD